MRTVSKSATFLATESVNSAPFKRGETEVQIVWQGKAQNSSPILRCTFLARRSAKLIANFSATMVTSLPSFSLSLSLYLSLSPNVPHAQYRKRFRASYNMERFTNLRYSLPFLLSCSFPISLSFHFISSEFGPSFSANPISNRGYHIGKQCHSQRWSL